MDNNNQYLHYTGQLNQFSSSFWIEGKWIIKTEIDDTNIKYIINPYK